MSEYEDLIELGFEGVDRFATKYHDIIADKVAKTRQLDRKAKKGKQDDERAREGSEGVRNGGGDSFTGHEPPSHRYKLNEPLVPPEDHLRGLQTPPQGPNQKPGRLRQYPPFVALAQAEAHPMVPDRVRPPPLLPPPPSTGPQVPHSYYPRTLDPLSRYYSPPQRQRALSDPGDYPSDSDSIVDSKEGSRNMYNAYMSSGRREDGCGGDAAENLNYGYAIDGRRVIARDRERLRRNEDRGDRRRDHTGDGEFDKRIVEERAYYRTTPDRRPAARSDAAWAGAMVPNATAHEHRRPRPARRGSSWSPPRRRSREDQESPSRWPSRPRSPNSYRAIGTIVGVLAGGLAGSQVKKGDKVPNTMATIAGAVVGGLGGMEAEKAVDRRLEQRRREEAWRADEREKRRSRRRSDREQY